MLMEDSPGTGYHFHALTQTQSSVGKHEAVKNTAKLRLRDYGTPLPHIWPGFAGCQEGLASCTCEAERLPFDHIHKGEFVQLSLMGDVRRGIPNQKPDFVAHKVVSKTTSGLVLQAADGVGEPFMVIMGVDEAQVDCGQLQNGDGRFYFYKCGFVPDERNKTPDGKVTSEFATQAVYTRRVYGMRCMFDRCTLPYDGTEHGMFRLSDTYMFCVSLFYRFQTELLSSRSVVVFRLGLHTQFFIFLVTFYPVAVQRTSLIRSRWSPRTMMLDWMPGHSSAP